MDLIEAELKIERIRGTGPGGQRRNKVATCVRITHIPTGIVVVADKRTQTESLRLARKDMERKLSEAKASKKASEKKARRDKAIHDTTTIRTYDFKSGIVKDHRTKKIASIEDVLRKGRFDLLNP